MSYNKKFLYDDVPGEHIEGSLFLNEISVAPGGNRFRTGEITLTSGKNIALNLIHSRATSEIIYTSKQKLSKNLLHLFCIDGKALAAPEFICLPGQLILGPARTRLFSKAVWDVIGSPVLTSTLDDLMCGDVITIPVLREGIKYGVSESLFDHYGIISHEIVTDVHHDPDPSIPAYGRKSVVSIFKDGDLSEEERNAVQTAFIGDSIASGTVVITILNKLKLRFPDITTVELIAPLATLRGLARIAQACPENITLRAHVFETILNALLPDYYYSAHFPDPELHIIPDLQEEYEHWWGEDKKGKKIADTACAGYGWSEAFFTPTFQINMINEQLNTRHGADLKSILTKHLQRN